jgi:Acyl-CoA dehydrogenase, C-terminal domain
MSNDFIAAAEAVFRRSPTGTDALVELEWAPVLDSADEFGAETFTALFRAQGRSLASTPALAVLLAHQLGASNDPQDFGTVASYRATLQGGDLVRMTVSGDYIHADRVVVDTGQSTLWVGSPATFSYSGSQPLDPGYANVSAEIAVLDRLAIDGLGGRRLEAERLSRLAAAQEMLGVSEQLMSMAVAYALDRRQFGAPIGSFPAIQQILAAAEVELVGLRNCCDVVMGEEVHLVEPDPVHDAMLVKALAGRVSRRVSQATLQTFGGVGFTWEHDHHRYQRRVLTLDALFGSYHELVVQLGTMGIGGPLRRVGVL